MSHKMLFEFCIEQAQAESISVSDYVLKYLKQCNNAEFQSYALERLCLTNEIDKAIKLLDSLFAPPRTVVRDCSNYRQLRNKLLKLCGPYDLYGEAVADEQQTAKVT